MKKGITAAALCYFIWGILPIYWKLINGLQPLYILCMRITLSSILCLAVMAFRRTGALKAALAQRGKLFYSMGAGVFVSINWLTYIWTVNSGHILESSLGYYINPLTVMICGTIIFGERMKKWEMVSVALAAMGVGIMVVRYGQVPWAALILAASFTTYGALKKLAGFDAFTGMFIETATVLPLALAYIVYSEFTGQGALGVLDAKGMFLLSLAGVVTAVPIFLYGIAVSNIPLTMVGFFQYIMPTMSLVLGVFLYHEPFTAAHGVAFGFIWSALALYVLSKTGVIGAKKEQQTIEEAV